MGDYFPHGLDNDPGGHSTILIECFGKPDLLAL